MTDNNVQNGFDGETPRKIIGDDDDVETPQRIIGHDVVETPRKIIGNGNDVETPRRGVSTGVGETKNQPQKNEKIFPDDWVETSLGEVCEINPTESLSRGKIAKSVPMDCIDSFTRQISRFEEKAFNGGMKFRNGDTLLARITPCLENGKTAFVDVLDENEIGFGSTEYIVIREKQELSDKKFLYYLAISPRFREIAIKAMTGTSGRQRVQTDVLVNKKFLLPPLPEQQAIAKILSAFDDKIELLREQNKTLEEMGQVIFGRWFVDFEFGNDEKNGVETPKKNDGETPRRIIGNDDVETPRRGVSTGTGTETQKPLPEGWRVGRLSEIAEFLNGIALQKFPPEDEYEYLPVVKIRELKAGITEQTDKASKNIDPKYIVDNGDVLFSWSGSLEIVIWKYGKGALNQHLFKVSSQKYPKWFYYLWTLYHLEDFRSIASNKATTMGHIQRHHLDQAQVIIPDFENIKKMNSILEPILQKFEDNNSQIQSLARSRDELLPRLMNGEVRVGF